MVFTQYMDEQASHDAVEGSAQLREQLVHHIYALVERADGWPETVALLDALCRNVHTEAGEIDSLLPHIDRADLLLGEMERLELSRQQSETILDRIPMAIAMISPQCELLSSNRRADILLSKLITHNSKRLIRLPSRAHNKQLHDAVAEVHGNRSSSKALHFGHLKLWLCRHDHDPEKLLLFLADHTNRREINITQLQQLYELTGREAAVTSELCNGISDIEAVASALEISVSTVRTHLKKVYAKTDTRSQAELMKMVMLNPALSMGEVDDAQATGEARLHQKQRLYSDRTISFAEYGSRRGKPVLFCHAMTGCRLMIPRNHQPLHRAGIRLIVPDRAGFGRSTKAETDPFGQWIEDARLLLEQLGIDRCDLIGHSGGAPFAFELVAACPELVDRLHLISAIVPITDTDDLKLFMPLNRMGIYLCRKNPTIAHSFISLTLKRVANNPNSYFDQIIDSTPSLDLEMLSTNLLKQWLIDGFAESRHQGVDHMVDELMHITRHWHIDPDQIRCPVHLWHGTDDPIAPPMLTRRMAESLPDLQSQQWIDESGHYLLYSHWKEIIRQLASG